METLVVLLGVLVFIAVPGVGAALAAYGPGEIGALTGIAAVFGLGFAAAGGCAFALAATHTFGLDSFLLLWGAVSAVVWGFAVWRAPLRAQFRAFGADLRSNWLPLGMGLVPVLAVLVIGTGYMRLLDAPREIYYLNGMQIANSGGVPSKTLEYGQAWPPATDKIFLDSFTGVVALISRSAAIGPAVLLWTSILGTTIGLWAIAWELGLRRTSGLLPLLLVGNMVLLNVTLTGEYTEYRAEDFGRAVAYCAFALGIAAIRKRRWLLAIPAGVVLGAASGSHLIPVVVVALGLTCYGMAEFVRLRAGSRGWAAVAAGAVIAEIGGAAGVAIRVFAGGAFGLTGASNPSGYNAIHTPFDPTAYLYYGAILPRDSGARGHWYVQPGQLVRFMLAGNGIDLPTWALWMLAACALAVAVAVFLSARDDLRAAGLVGFGIALGTVLIALAFDYRYRIYIDATFAERRLYQMISFGLLLVGLAAVETVAERIGARLRALGLAITLAAVLALTAGLVPAQVPQAFGSRSALVHTSRHLTELYSWIRTHTPCGARFAVNVRTEGTYAALTGRFAMLEGMGPFLRPARLPYVTALMLAGRHFFESPRDGESFLRKHHIMYVVAETHVDPGPLGKANFAALQSAPFLHSVYHNHFVTVYRVRGARPTPISPLLRGPVLHCQTSPLNF